MAWKIKHWYLKPTFVLMLVLSGLSLLAIAEEQVTTVSHVDLSRYMGTWYEIASMPMFFQRNCTGNTTAEYTMLPNNTVKVRNSCDTEKGRISAVGTARVADKKSNAKLKVSFLRLPILSRLATGDYWIIDLDGQNYDYAVVGQGSRHYGWILSRGPAIEKSTLAGIARRLTQQGYNVCDFNITPQKNGFTTARPLCEALKQ